MRRDDTFFKAARYIETLKNKWAHYSTSLVSALADEEVKIRREEVLRQIAALKQSE